MQPIESKRAISESGNIFIIVLAGVVLFAALIYSMSRGFREAPSDISAKEAKVAVSGIVSYTRDMGQAISEMIQFNSCSQSEISFSVVDTDSYHFPTRDECKVFHSSGGGILKKDIMSGVNGIYYSSDNYVEGIGTDCDSDAGTITNCTEFTVLFEVDQIVCEALNNALGHGSPVMQTNPDNISLELHDGLENYDGLSGEIIATAGKTSGCVGYDGKYYYYHVLLGR